MPYLVDVQVDLSLCWSHISYCKFCCALAPIMFTQKITLKGKEYMIRGGSSVKIVLPPFWKGVYGKCPKISNTLFHTFFCLFFFLFMQLFPNILSGMANSVDPDQEQSDLGLHCLHMPFC